MKLDQQKLKQLRNQRAWSQNQLAEVSGLSLRTVQRIEKTGVASLESVKALAAVYEVNLNQLMPAQIGWFAPTKRKIVSSIGLLFAILASLMLVPVNASPIMLDVVLNSANEQLASAQLLSQSSQQSELLIDGIARVILKAETQPDNKVSIKVKFYLFTDQQEALVAEPQVISADNKTAEIQIDDYTLLLTPHL